MTPVPKMQLRDSGKPPNSGQTDPEHLETQLLLMQILKKKQKKQKTVFTSNCVGLNPQPLDQEADTLPLCQRSIADSKMFISSLCT